MKRLITALFCLALLPGLALAEGTAVSATAKAKPKAAGSTVVIKMAGGDVIKIKLFTKDAPVTTANFIKLVKNGFYNGLTFHRVEPGFVVQGGDPNGNGSGGPGWTIPGEFSQTLKHVEGTVAMARTQDPNSAGSQFYICLAPAPFLDKQYAIFGKVTKGMDAVKRIKVGDRMEKVTLQ